MASDFNSCNASKLGYFIESPLGYRDAGPQGPITIRGLAQGVGTILGRIKKHGLAPTGNVWTQNYIATTVGPPPAGPYILNGAPGSGPGNQPQGVVQSLDTVHAKIRRDIVSYTVLAADAAYVGQPVFMTVNVFVAGGSTGLDLFTSTPALSSSYANCIAGTFLTTIPAVNGFFTTALGFNLPAVGSSFSVGSAISGDTSLLTFTGSTFNFQVTGNGIAGGSFYTVG